LRFEIPDTQRAIQLVGQHALRLNDKKPVVPPGPYQVLCRVEAVGLCFSDLKLLQQFSRHARKGEIVSGIEPAVLKELPSYVPGEAPTVPGHETVVRVWAVGDAVTRFRPGERYLVQTDYRWLRTADGNAAFGYNFEGALQEFVLMDERVITSPEGESMLIPASEQFAASAIALVEPWACVEDAYATQERRTLKAGGRMLVAAEAAMREQTFAGFLRRYGNPAHITWLSRTCDPPRSEAQVLRVADPGDLVGASYDDIIYFGARPEAVEGLFSKLAPHGLLNVVLCGGQLGRPVAVAVGRVHYGGIRVIGTSGHDPALSMGTIPTSGEIRRDDRVHVVGAGGPMGVMHVIRDVCLGLDNVAIVASDIDAERLAALSRIAGPLASEHGVSFRAHDSREPGPSESFTYTILMVPAPALVSEAVARSDRHAIVNVFAGIPAEVTAQMDLDRYIEKQIYLTGTSGSVLADMRTVLAKVEAGTLDTNLSVAAVCGLEGAPEGMTAVEKRGIPGKIIVYPACRGLRLIKLEQMAESMPRVAALLANGLWNFRAENALLGSCGDGRSRT
jgi:threonine dehydrogenase-like Zn-dependent dehydrogenase